VSGQRFVVKQEKKHPVLLVMVAGLVPQVKSAGSSAANETRLDAVGPSPSIGREAST